MKTAVTLLTLFVLFPLSTSAQDYTQWRLPEAAKARLGKCQHALPPEVIRVSARNALLNA